MFLVLPFSIRFMAHPLNPAFRDNWCCDKPVKVLLLIISSTLGNTNTFTPPNMRKCTIHGISIACDYAQVNSFLYLFLHLHKKNDIITPKIGEARYGQKNTLAWRIKDLRKHKGLTQKQLASELGISYNSVIDYENGRREPNAKALVRLEQFLE